MKLDLTSFAFGFAINGSNGNPNWATALGQGYLHKINQSDSINEILKGLIYCSVPLDRIQTKIGKGGKVYKGTDPESGIVTGSVFNKIYVNGNLVPDCKVIIVLTKDTTPSHEGRLRLKYSPHNAILNEQGDVALSNADQIEKIRAALGLTPNACWFVYEIEVVGQDSLFLSAGIADSSANVSYASTSDLHDKWNDIIVAAGGSPIKPPEGVGVYQLITYGAPGTGKSHTIDNRTNESNSIRVTFHPDTDYSAFVGAYKPTMDELERYALDATGQTHKIEVKEKSIVYSFVPQAFMKAYVEAWRRYTNASLQGDAKTYYLVIEEINRGNCAQIFGDLFQLLDRADNGFSAYAITPDDDIQEFLETDKDYKLVDISLSGDIKKTTETGEKIIATAADIKAGKKLVLPPNLCIWATMNTSDQSLFPIDSAFKRRWDWEYVPIIEGKDKDGNPLGWKIAFDVPKKVEGGPDVTVPFEYDWWEFVKRINEVIDDTTHSEDKKLGYFFVKPMEEEVDGGKKKVISAKRFLGKVIFYLWNDVFKDYGLDKIFTKDGKPVAFHQFFDRKTGAINVALIKEFIEKLPEVKE